MGSDAWPELIAASFALVASVGTAFLGSLSTRRARESQEAAQDALLTIRDTEKNSLGRIVWSGELPSPPRPDPSDRAGGQDPGLEPRVSREADPVEFTTLWALNQERIDAYHTIATSQSRISFVSSQVVTALGFILIIAVGIIAAQARTTIGAISAGSVGVIGGGLSAYISSTFMRAQGEASAQLQQFFLQPVEFARVLAAERLLEGMTDEDKSKTRAAMITSMMKASAPQTSDRVLKKG